MRCVAESCGRDPGGTTRGSVLCLHRLRRNGLSPLVELRLGPPFLRRSLPISPRELLHVSNRVVLLALLGPHRRLHISPRLGLLVLVSSLRIDGRGLGTVSSATLWAELLFDPPRAAGAPHRVRVEAWPRLLICGGHRDVSSRFSGSSASVFGTLRAFCWMCRSCFRDSHSARGR